MSGCFVGRKGENYGAKTPLEAGSQRGPARPGVGAAPPVPAPNTGGLPTEMGARLLSSSGMLQRPVLIPPQPPSVPRAAPRHGRGPPQVVGFPCGAALPGSDPVQRGDARVPLRDGCLHRIQVPHAEVHEVVAGRRGLHGLHGGVVAVVVGVAGRAVVVGVRGVGVVAIGVNADVVGRAVG